MHVSPVPPGPAAPGPWGAGLAGSPAALTPAEAGRGAAGTGAGSGSGAGAGAGAGTARVLRTLVGVAAGFCALAIVIGEARYRGYEASIGAHAVRFLTGYPVDAIRSRQVLIFGYDYHGKPGLLGLQVSLGCSSVLLVTPILLATALLMCFGRVAALRVLAAAAVAGALVVVFNALRLVVIAALVGAWGPESGFGWGHTLFGSVLTLIGMSGALAVFWFVLSFRKPADHRPARMVRRRPPGGAAEEVAAADGDA